jgi:ribonuclease J
LLLIKYGILKERQELNLEQIRKDGCTPEALEEANTKIINADNKKNRLSEMKTWSRALPGESPKSISIGNIKITPFFNCHSIYDSHMFLIEAEGKRVWHTGDYRLHGYLGKGLFPTLQKYATNIDTLITEGTMLNRNDDCIHEYEVAERMASVMKTYKYVFVLASATDIERLASIKNASEKTKKRMYVCSKFMISTMSYFTEHESELSHGLFSFSPRMYGRKYWGRMKKRGFVFVAGTSQKSKVANLLKELPIDETILIYSSWEGYYTIPEQVEANPDYKNFRELFNNVVDIHTSGHADKSTIQKVIEIVKPKEVICIHKELGVELEF